MDPLMELALYASETTSKHSTDPFTEVTTTPSPSTHPKASLQPTASVTYQDVLIQISSATKLEVAQQLVEKYYVYLQEDPSCLSVAFDKLAALAAKRFRILSSTDVNNSARTGIQSKSVYRDVPKTAPFISDTTPLFHSKNKSEAFRRKSIEEHITQIKQLRLRLSALLKEQPSRFKTGDLCNFLHGLAFSGVEIEEACRHIIREMQCRDGKYSVKQLQEALWSFTKCLELRADAKGGINIALHDSEFINFVLKGIKDLIGQKQARLYPQQLASILRCLVRLSHREEALMQLLGQHILKHQKEFSQSDWTSCVTAFTHFGIPLKGTCQAYKRPHNIRDWEHPPAPKRPKPMSEC